MDTKEMNMKEIEKPAKKKGKVGAVFFGLLILLIYITLVSIPQLFVLIPAVLQASTESMALYDPVTQPNEYMQSYMDTYLQKMQDYGAAVTTVTAIGTLVAVIVVVLWYYFGVYKKNKMAGMANESVWAKLKNVKSIAFIVIGSIATYAFAMLIYNVIEICAPNLVEIYQLSMGSVLGGAEILGSIVAVVFAPIGEETALRGLVMNRAKKSFGLIGCMVLSGILFGVFHMNPVQGLYAIPIGMFYGFVAYKYKSVIPAIICHFINNLIAMTIGGLFTNTIVDIIVILVLGAVTVWIGSKIDYFRNGKVAVND